MDTEVVDRLVAALGADRVQRGTDSDPRFHRDWTAAAPVVPLAVVLPRETREVSRALALCHAAGVPVVPQGGLTGLVGGAQPQADAVVINLSRMNAPPRVDAVARTVTAQAGVTLQALQEAADAAGLMFPVDFGARGSCQVGGAISTNAGGVQVMRFGMMRAQVLGLEAVLADGEVIDSMNALMKNNTGHDLKQLFIGTEGTLGIVTQAVLRLAERPAGRSVALARVPDVTAAYQVLRRLGRALPGLTAFEAMWPDYYAFATAALGEAPLPLDEGLTLLIELQGPDPQGDDERLTAELAELMGAGTVADATVAQSGVQAERFWALREANAELMRHFKRLSGYDVSIAAGATEAFVASCRAALAALSPPIRLLCFGHLGDGNLHLVVATDDAPGVDARQVKRCVHDAVGAFRGSISAEHGIGRDKRDDLGITRNAAEIALMRRLKAALDPSHILNPGKLLPA
ncbi:MAG: FAD-binding oxidoreductase [Burkholderiaceae bacterium]|nr:FAD-binding oxidoreductase [Burkholderiaceae bacterium]